MEVLSPDPPGKEWVKHIELLRDCIKDLTVIYQEHNRKLEKIEDRLKELERRG